MTRVTRIYIAAMMAIQTTCPMRGRIRRPMNSRRIRRTQNLICVRSVDAGIRSWLEAFLP
jgi:hypothetical protein